MSGKRRTTTVREQIEQYIARAIQNGRYNPGERINEAELAVQFGVSRTPVHEVLGSLCASGFLERIPNKGFYVVKLDDDTRYETYQAAGMVEYCCAELALSHLTEEDFLKMEECIDRIDLAIKYRNFSDYVACQEKFHNILVDRCPNKVLASLWRQLVSSPVPMTMTPAQFPGDPDDLYRVLRRYNEQHREILDKLRSGDLAGLKTLMLYHYGQDLKA